MFQRTFPLNLGWKFSSFKIKIQLPTCLTSVNLNEINVTVLGLQHPIARRRKMARPCSFIVACCGEC
jgi:hypothetical protein